MTFLTAPECVTAFIEQADRLGIQIRFTADKMINLDAAYHALPGKPGYILLTETQPMPNLEKQCRLLTHEMVHVLQHWKGELKAVPPLGWPQDGAPPGRQLSSQEREAYTAEKYPMKVFEAIKKLRPY